MALIVSPNVAEAAEAAGVGERTLYRWLAEEPQFSADYAEARRQVVAAATARLQSVAGKAVATLESLMDDPTVPPAVRMAASVKLWDMREKSQDREEQEQRIQALEEQFRQMFSTNGNGRAVHA